jgi:L-lactate dehydrogenase complex protein LldF
MSAAEPFPVAARRALADSQLRRNLARATRTIRDKRIAAVAELEDWEDLREAGRALKDRVLRHLDEHLVALERRVQDAGGVVHWARDAAEMNAIVTELVAAAGSGEVVKAKSLTTEETRLNDALERRGIEVTETDLAELIIQLGHDTPSHVLVPAIHRNRAEIRELFARHLPEAPASLSDDPGELAEVARRHLRRRFLDAHVGITGANFAVAETGTIALVESEGNGRMCSTLPELLITVMGIEKVIPSWQDLEVYLQLLPRSSTAERMNPYTSLWTGVTPGDGPSAFHLVLLDNGRTNVLADALGRQALRCIRCSACMNVCPVYERTGGHAYGSVYPGPIGAILAPQLAGLAQAQSLPYASTLCGACYDACPVKIDIPAVLADLRRRIVERPAHGHHAERVAMRAMAGVFASRRRYEAAQRAGRLGQAPLVRGGAVTRLPGALGGWTLARDIRPLPRQSFRDWWRARDGAP